MRQIYLGNLGRLGDLGRHLGHVSHVIPGDPWRLEVPENPDVQGRRLVLQGLRVQWLQCFLAFQETLK